MKIYPLRIIELDCKSVIGVGLFSFPVLPKIYESTLLEKYCMAFSAVLAGDAPAGFALVDTMGCCSKLHNSMT